MKMTFIQYFLPNGRREPVSCEVSDETFAMVEQIEARGYRFECEVLRTGEVSMTIFDPKEEVDVCIELCQNGPEVSTFRDKLVRDGYEMLVKGVVPCE